MMYWDIFFCFLKIGAFSFGGGYAALPLIQGEPKLRKEDGLPRFAKLKKVLVEKR